MGSATTQYEKTSLQKLLLDTHLFPGLARPLPPAFNLAGTDIKACGISFRNVDCLLELINLQSLKKRFHTSTGELFGP